MRRQNLKAIFVTPLTVNHSNIVISISSVSLVAPLVSE